MTSRGSDGPSADDVVAKIHGEIERRRTVGVGVGDADGVAGPREVGAASVGSSRSTPSGAGTTGGRTVSFELPRLEIQPPFQPRVEDRYALHELTDFHDVPFVENAYRALLKRMPDPVGLRHHMEGLRTGRRSKVGVLGRLRYSPEGRRHGVRVSGLFWRFAFEQVERVPVAGYVLQLVAAIAMLPRAHRNARRSEAYVHSLLGATAAHLSTLATELARHFEARARDEARAEEELGRRLGEELASRQIRLDEQAASLDEQAASLAEHATRIDSAERLLAEHDSGIRGEVAARESVSARAGELHSDLETLRQLVDDRENELTNRLNAEARAREAGNGVVTADLAAARVRMDAQGDLIRLLESKLEGEFGVGLEQAEESLRELGESVQALEHWARDEASAREELGGRISDMTPGLERTMGAVDRLKAQSSQLELRLGRLLEEARRRLPAPFDDEQLHVLIDDRSHQLDAFYAAFEDEFRGSRQDIKERLRVYLPLIEAAKLGDEQNPLLDLGCGRGEWLELAGEAGFSAWGLDRSRPLIEACRERGLEAAEGDVLEYLAGVKDASIGVVTGFHIIEHVSLEELVRLFDETVRVLRPGGLAIFETPNPANVLVGSYSFYLDPTHRNPLPSRAMEFLAEARGLCDVKVMLLNAVEPSERIANDAGDELTRRFNAYFYAARDYAVVGRKP